MTIAIRQNETRFGKFRITVLVGLVLVSIVFGIVAWQFADSSNPFLGAVNFEEVEVYLGPVFHLKNKVVLGREEAEKLFDLLASCEFKRISRDYRIGGLEIYSYATGLPYPSLESPQRVNIHFGRRGWVAGDLLLDQTSGIGLVMKWDESMPQSPFDPMNHITDETACDCGESIDEIVQLLEEATATRD